MADGERATERRDLSCAWRLEEEGLDFIVEDEHQRAAGTSQHVGEGSLEEGAGALGLGDGGPAVHGAGVGALGRRSAGLHHHAPSHSVEGVRHDTGYSGHNLYKTTHVNLTHTSARTAYFCDYVIYLNIKGPSSIMRDPFHSQVLMKIASE